MAMPKEWNGGSIPSSTVGSCRCMIRSVSRMVVSRFRCVSGTALGRLSEPLVKRTTASRGGSARRSGLQST